MNIAIVGCGFVFDIYMRTLAGYPEIQIVGVFDRNPERSKAVSGYYGFVAYESYEDLLNDPAVEIVVNLTNIASHFDVSKRALLAGKHVYSEKPLTKSLPETRELFEIAASKGLVLSGAPCNFLSESMSTLIDAIRSELAGKPLLVYAELDDNPIHLMDFASIQSPSGAPWPLREEVLEGCTYEHVGYHLVWLCAAFGPVTSITAFSQELLEGKCPELTQYSGTPDYSVACLGFNNGVTARVTCSVVAPRNHKIQVIGRDGAIYSEGYRRFDSPIYVERFSHASLSARKLSLFERHPQLGSLFGIGGKRIPLLRHPKSCALHSGPNVRRSVKSRLLDWIRRKQVYAQDKLLGVWEMNSIITNKHQTPFAPDFLIHINELTLLIQGAGPSGFSGRPSTTFSSPHSTECSHNPK